MIVSASRRTDIPAFYSPWFFNRLKSGFCMVRNPFNPEQTFKVSLKPEDVDAFVFWSKNPAPMIPRLDEVDSEGYRYLFLFTLNDYPVLLEPHTGSVDERIRVFRQLAEKIGSARVIWRYDPVIISNLTDYAYHENAFRYLVKKLEGSTLRVITSVVDFYRKTQRRLRSLEDRGMVCDSQCRNSGQMASLLETMHSIADEAGIELQTCAEETQWSVPAGGCIDGVLIEKLFGTSIDKSNDKGQRKHCLCTKSRDIGAVDTCLHGCTYCYSTRSHEAAVEKNRQHDAESPFL